MPASHRSALPICLLALFVLMQPAFLAAQYVEDSVRPFWGVGGSSARARGLGNAYTGIADDESALYFNPAGLAHVVKGEINVGLDHMVSATEFGSASQGTGTTLAATRLVNLGLALPLPGTRLTMGAGFYQIRAFERGYEAPFLTYFVDESGTVVDSLLEELRAQEEGALGCFSAGLGYQVSARFAIGATVEILSGGNERTEDSTFPWNDSSAYYIYKPGYRSAAMSLGIMLAPVPWWRIGLLLRTPQKISIKERSQGTETAGWEKFEYSSQGPFYLRAGTSLSLGPWLVAADAYWFDYSQIKFESDLWDYDGDVPVEPIDIGINDDLRRHYNSVLGFAVGSEYLLPVFNAKVRAGYRYDPAFKDSQGSDGLTAISVGFSVVPVPQLRVDFAAVQTSWALEMEEQWIVTNYSVNLLFRL